MGHPNIRKKFKQKTDYITMEKTFIIYYNIIIVIILMKFKLTPFIVFLILLAVFILTFYFCNRMNTEGFIAYNESSSALNQLYIPQYSSTNLVYKIHDSIYFDNKNGNVIELFGTLFSDSSTSGTIPTTNVVDTNGSTLTDIVLMSRSATTNAPMALNYYTSSNKTSGLSVDQSLVKTSMVHSYNYCITPNGSNFNSNANILFNYQTLYISWGTDTILHIYDCSNKNNVNIGTFLFRQSFDPIHSLYKGNITAPIGAYIADSDCNNNTYVKEPLYDSKKQNSLFQLSKNVLFDTTCRYLIIRNNDQITVYDGTLETDGINPKQIYSNVSAAGTITNTPTCIEHTNFSSFQPLYISDTNAANFILYLPIPSTDKTMVAVISMDPTVPGFISPRNVITFNQKSTTNNGIDGNSSIKSPDKTTSHTDPSNNIVIKVPHEGSNYSVDASKKSSDSVDANTKGSDSSGNIPSLDSIISNYYSKYWNNNLPVTTINGVKQYSNDFLLKTQIIPPICPACPASGCGGNSPCSNCGGNGGSGISIDASSNINNHLIDTSNNSYKTLNKLPTIASTNIINPPDVKTRQHNLHDNGHEAVQGIVNGAQDLAHDAKGVVGGIINGIVQAGTTEPTPSSTSSTLTNTNSDKSQSSYDTNSSSSRPGPTFGNRIVPDGTPDQYSYYGSLPEKENSHFIPVTSDFSKFGR
jgi:hypothetical protein